MNNPYGVGTLTMKNGDVYQGSFKNGEMKLGQLTYKDDGSVYQGFFDFSKQRRQGVLISSDGKSKSYSDSFEGKNPGAPELSLDEIPKGNEEKSLVEHTNVAESPKTDKKLFGKNIHLVLEIRANIENDVETVVNRAKEETKKAEIKRVEDEKAAKKMEKERLANKGNKGHENNTDNNTVNSSGNSTDNSTNGSNSTDNSSGTGSSFPKVALISAATAAATAGLYYAYKKYNKSEKKSSDKRSETKRSDKSSKNMSSEKNQSENMSSAKRSEKKHSEKKRSAKRSAKRSEKKRSAKRSEKKR
jgi:hypothetical protein